MNPLFIARTSVEQVEEGKELCPKFDQNGLIPVITTDHKSGEILIRIGFGFVFLLFISFNFGIKVLRNATS